MSTRFKMEDAKVTPEFAEEAKIIRKAFETLETAVETLGDRDKKDQILDRLVDAYKDAVEIVQGDIKKRKKLLASRSHALTERDYDAKEQVEGALNQIEKDKKLKEAKAYIEKYEKEAEAYRASQAKKDFGGTERPEFPSGHPDQYDKEDPREAPKNIAAGHDPHDSFDPHLPRSPASPGEIKEASKTPMKASEDTAKDERDLGEHNQARGGREAIEDGKVEPQKAGEAKRAPGDKKGEVERQGPGSKAEAPKAAEYTKEHHEAADKKHPNQVNQKTPVQGAAPKPAGSK